MWRQLYFYAKLIKEKLVKLKNSGSTACILKTSNSQNDKKSIYELTNQFYFYKIIHEFSKANIPDARVNK